DGYTPAVRLINKDNQSNLDRTGLRFQSGMFKGMAPAGRLDIDSQGLLILTQDGRVAKKIIGQFSDLQKEYLVRVNCRASESQIGLLQHGLSLDDKPLKPAKVSQVNSEQLKFVLKEGKKRQIRRMCEAVGLRVYGLKRVRIGDLKLGKLAEGQWRFVAPSELSNSK
ncbi:MAG: pseudouridine synthase, partial [Pseudomonadota bacterium]